MIPAERKTLEAILHLTDKYLPRVTLCWWCGSPSDHCQSASETQPEKLCPGCWYCYTHQAPRFDALDA